MTLEVNLADVSSFLKFLDEDPNELFALCLLDAEGKEPCSGFGSFHLTHDQCIATLSAVPSVWPHASTLHVCLNKTNGKSRRTSDIIGCRVLCVDIDTVTDRADIRFWADTYACELVVESSPGKYHLYWRCSPTIPLDNWVKYQLALAQFFQGDKNLASKSKNIRVPGVPRVTKSGEEFLPHILINASELEGGDLIEPLTEAQIGELFPWINEEFDKAQKAAKEERKKLKNVLSGKSRELVVSVGVGRNNLLYEEVKEFVSGNECELVEEDAHEYSRVVNEAFLPPLDESEREKTARSAWEHGHERWVVQNEKRVKAQERLDKMIEETHVNGADTGAEDTKRLASGGAKLRDPRKQKQPEFQYDFEADDELRLNQFTDEAILSRVKQRFGGRILRTGEFIYVFDAKESVWRRQKPKEKELITTLAKQCCDDVVRSPEFLKRYGVSTDEIQKEKQIFNAQLDYKSISKKSQIAGSVFHDDEWTRKNISTFDENPYLLYLLNGVIDCQDPLVGARRAEPEDFLLVKNSNVFYDETAPCEEWEEFLLQVFYNNVNRVETVRFLQEVFGYSLTGCVDERLLFLHVGSGANGKSTVLSALRELMGDYSAVLNCSSLGKSGKGTMNAALERIGVKIEGKRVVILDDLDTQSQWNEAYVKNLTSDVIIAKKLYHEEHDIPNRAKFHIGCNEIPTPEGTSGHGLFRRICIIPYERRFSQDAAMDKKLKLMVKRELPGILNWALEGLARVIERGGKLDIPEDVSVAQEEYQREYYPVEPFLEDFFLPVKNIKSEATKLISSIKLLDIFNTYVQKKGGRPVSKNILSAHLIEKLGYERKRMGKRKETSYFVRINPEINIDELENESGI